MISLNNKTKLLLIVVVTMIGVYFGFEYILPLFTPFILAYFIAWLLLPIVRFLKCKLRIPKVIGGILSLGVIGSIVVWGISYLGNLLIKQTIILMQNMPIYLQMLSGRVDSFCGGCDKFLGIELGSARRLMDSNIEGMLNTIKTDIMPIITSHSLIIAVGIAGVVGIIIITLVSILLLIKDEEVYGESFRSNVFYPEIHLVTSKLSETGIAYLRAQLIMMVFVAIICSVGLLIIKNKYALLIGIGIGLFDAFPILGSGIILVPWSIVSIFNHDLYSAAVLMTLYLACQLIRQFIEPRILGNRIGIKPLYTLMAMYVGFEIFGFLGFFLGPLALVIIITIIKESEERLALRKT